MKILDPLLQTRVMKTKLTLFDYCSLKLHGLTFGHMNETKVPTTLKNELGRYSTCALYRHVWDLKEYFQMDDRLFSYQ